MTGKVEGAPITPAKRERERERERERGGERERELFESFVATLRLKNKKPVTLGGASARVRAGESRVRKVRRRRARTEQPRCEPSGGREL